MADRSPFPIYNKPTNVAFSRERVVDYLLRLTTDGHQVHTDGQDYVLAQDDGEARLHLVEGKWRVSRIRLGILSTYGDAGNEDQLNRILESALGPIPERPRRARLNADTPASNYRSIAGLIGSSEIQAVFDTYLDNQSLEQLIHIVSFGNATFAAQVRLLGTTASTHSRAGRPPRLTKAGVDAWAAQLNIQAAACYRRTVNTADFFCWTGAW